MAAAATAAAITQPTRQQQEKYLSLDYTPPTYTPPEYQGPCKANFLESVRQAELEGRSARAMVLDAVRQAGAVLQHASPGLQADKEVALAAVRQSGWALEWASDNLRGDRAVVLAAVNQSGWALQFASARLREERQVVMAAVAQSGWALQFAAPQFHGDRELVLIAAADSGEVLELVPPELLEDKELAVVAVTQNSSAMVYLPDELKEDPDIQRLWRRKGARPMPAEIPDGPAGAVYKSAGLPPALTAQYLPRGGSERVRGEAAVRPPLSTPPKVGAPRTPPIEEAEWRSPTTTPEGARVSRVIAKDAMSLMMESAIRVATPQSREGSEGAIVV